MSKSYLGIDVHGMFVRRLCTKLCFPGTDAQLVGTENSLTYRVLYDEPSYGRIIRAVQHKLTC
jgi:hypothetical protein